MEIPYSYSLGDGRRCTIRIVTEADAGELCELVARGDIESDFLNRLPGEFDMTVEEEREFLRDRLADVESIQIVAEVAGKIVATAGASGVKLRRYPHQVELGVTVLKDFWGRGLGRRLTESIVDWGRAKGLRKITLKVFVDNERAIALYRSLGFVEEGRLRGDALRRDGSYSDTIIMAKHYVAPDG